MLTLGIPDWLVAPARQLMGHMNTARGMNQRPAQLLAQQPALTRQTSPTEQTQLLIVIDQRISTTEETLPWLEVQVWKYPFDVEMPHNLQTFTTEIFAPSIIPIC
jgi:hypothetical protein